jgi:nucleoid DNA-binding protein
LKPKKAKELIPAVAAEVKLPEQVVKDIVYTYWQEIRKSLSGLKHNRVHITNLGDFSVMHWKIDDKIKMLEQFEENNKLKGMQQMTARFRTVELVYSLKEIKKQVEQEQQRKEFIKTHKRLANESKGEHNQNLES